MKIIIDTTHGQFTRDGVTLEEAREALDNFWLKSDNVSITFSRLRGRPPIGVQDGNGNVQINSF